MGGAVNMISRANPKRLNHVKKEFRDGEDRNNWPTKHIREITLLRP
jgi:hypothetical protein